MVWRNSLVNDQRLDHRLVSVLVGWSYWKLRLPQITYDPFRVLQNVSSSENSSMNNESLRPFLLLGGGRYKQKRWNDWCGKVKDSWANSNDACGQEKLVLVEENGTSKLLTTKAIPPPRHWWGKENVLWPGGAMSRHFASSPTGRNQVLLTEQCLRCVHG